MLIAVVVVSSVVFYVDATWVAFAVSEFFLNVPDKVAETASELAVVQVMQDPVGFVIMLSVPQLSLLFFPILLGLLSPAGMRRNLGLVRGAWPAWTWVAAAMATPLIGMIAGGILSQFVSDSPALQDFAELILHHSRRGFLIPAILAISVFPGLCEEMLFRGFLLRQISRIAPTTVSLVVSSVLFAGFHLDPVHVLGVLPLGLWLGFITIRSKSLFPAMFAHATNNFVSVLVIAMDDTENVLAPPSAKFQLIILIAGLLGLMGVGISIRRAALKESAAENSDLSNAPVSAEDR